MNRGTNVATAEKDVSYSQQTSVLTSLSFSLSFLSCLTGGVEFLELGPSNLKLKSESS